jgi:hypothetical protein
MRFGHSAIRYRGGDNGCDIGRFAERLDRYARHRLDLHNRPIHGRVSIDYGVSVARLHGQSLSVGRQIAADWSKNGVRPIGARILAVADGLDGSGAHGDIGWANCARLDEIARASTWAAIVDWVAQPKLE